MTLAPKPDSAAIRRYCDDNQVGMYEARQVLRTQWRREQLKTLRAASSELYTVEQCRDVICDLIEFVTEISDV